MPARTFLRKQKDPENTKAGGMSTPQSSRRHVAPEEQSEAASATLESSGNFSDIQRLVQNGNGASPHDNKDNSASPGASNAALVPLFLQAKLKVGAIDDPLEAEADQIAGEAVAASTPPSGAYADGPSEPSVKSMLSPQGGYFQSHFGASFGNVKVHTGPAAEQAAAALQARAFTQGNNIFFGHDEYQPGTQRGQFLLAHELAHVAQQTGHAQQPLRRKPIDATCSAEQSACEAIPENPLADYPYLAIALDSQSLQLLQDAAYRREHLRQSIPYDGPQGLFFAQAQLSNFLAPGTEYVSREELLAAMMPPLLDAARNHTDPQPYIAEVARNEAARQMLEQIGNPLVNVELPDPDGLLQDLPTELTFIVNFKRLQDDHGALALASLDPISMRSAYLWTMVSLNDAEQLSSIALLNARAEWLFQNVADCLNDMAADPADYTQDEVYEYAHKIMPNLLTTATNLAGVLTPANRDQTGIVTKAVGMAQGLSIRADAAMQAMNDFRTKNMPDKTAGETWDENADDIRNAAEKDWDEGGWSYFAWFGNKLGLGANKLMHGAGNVASGFSIDMHAARAHAYRLGHISYNDYSGFHPMDIVKGAVLDLAVALPFFGEGIGAGASGLLGLEGGSTAATVTEGAVGGFSSNFLGAAANDASSLLASHLSLSESERRFQAAQIGGPLSWVESGAWGGMVGGAGALAKFMPRPSSAPTVGSVEPQVTPADEAETGAPVSTSGDEVSAADTDVSTPAGTAFGPAKGIKGFLQRSLLNRLLSTALEGAEPLNTMPTSSGPIGDQLLSGVNDTGPMGVSDPMFSGPFDFANAPDVSTSSVAAPVDVTPVNSMDLQAEVTEMPELSSSPGSSPTQSSLPDMGGVRPGPGERTTTWAQWADQYREQRVERRIDAIFAQLEQSAGQQVAQGELAPAMAIDLQRAIRQALTNLRTSGRRDGNAAFGTMLHAELARVLRAAGFPPDAIAHVELRLGAFNTLPASILQQTVDQWFQNEGQAYMWLRGSVPSSVLNSLIADIRPDFEISIGGNNIAFDLTSRERATHLAKTMLYAAILAREGQMTRVQEYYWVRYRWRGR